eukprot:5636239-Pyramimonas_sp.AAC.1
MTILWCTRSLPPESDTTLRSEMLVLELQRTIEREQVALELLTTAELQIAELLSEETQTTGMLQQKWQEREATLARQEELCEGLAKVDRALKQHMKEANMHAAEHQAIEAELQGILVHQYVMIFQARGFALAAVVKPKAASSLAPLPCPDGAEPEDERGVLEEGHFPAGGAGHVGAGGGQSGANKAAGADGRAVPGHRARRACHRRMLPRADHGAHRRSADPA